jgi:hypothetical protein
MPHRLPERLTELADAIAHSLLFFSVGALIGVAQIFGDAQRITLRIALARAITVGGLATAAGAILIWLPDAPLIGLIGAAAALASLGTSGLERLAVRLMGGSRGGEQ